ncbi:hypothetical protein FSW04_03575 [Baekduia soli]|uniref:Acetophenone carboxylase-like C-terminal domain-containing protein n=2 Tax=Baekduia soli TaxID=496014 RepID=A0A5B8U1Q5_9ACTN|nr:hypothetical protein FSW04_03575 [Baekduia soli]
MPLGPVTDDSVAALLEDFERRYAQQFGAEAGYADAGIVITGVRVKVSGVVRKPSVVRRPPAEGADAGAARRGHRDVHWEELGARASTAIWDGGRLQPGTTLEGPAVIELPDTTIVVRPGHRASIDEYGNAVVQVDAVRPTGPAAVAAGRLEEDV